jgi:hypothetical protein
VTSSGIRNTLIFTRSHVRCFRIGLALDESLATGTAPARPSQLSD